MCCCHARLSVLPPVCHKPVLCRNDWMNRAGFWRGGFLPPIPLCVVRKYGYLPKLGYFPLGLCPKLQTWKISPRRVDRVANNTLRRRRRRSSSLTTPIRQSTSRGCLIQVGRNPLTSLLRFVVYLLYNLFLQLTRL